MNMVNQKALLFLRSWSLVSQRLCLSVSYSILRMLKNSHRRMQICREQKKKQKNRTQVLLLRAEDESIAFHKRQTRLCWGSSALGKLTRQRERLGEGGVMGAEKREINIEGREVG